MTTNGVRPHGTRAKYVMEKCHCDRCRAANAAFQNANKKRQAQRAFGACPPPYVDAEPVRRHLRALMAAGVGRRRAAQLSGVPNGAISRLLYGTATRPPSVRVRPTTAAKLLAVTPDQVAGGALVDATGTRRRVQALVAVGWSGSEIMRRLGKIPTNFTILAAAETVTATTARAVRRLYDEIWDTPPPAANRSQAGAITRARRQAAARRWAPPLAWDDDTIDDPAATPDLGARGARGLDLDEVAHLRAGGCSEDEIARRTGVTVSAIEQAHHRARREAS